MRNTSNLGFVILILAVIGCTCPNPPESKNGANKTQSNNSANATDQSNKKCDLKIEQAPEVKGFRLGMTVQEIQKKVPQFKEKKPDEFGYSEIYFVNPNPKNEVPAGIVVKNQDSLIVELGILKGRVISVTSYVNPTDDIGVPLETYQDRVPESLKLPYKIENDSRGANYKSIICDGFEVKAGRKSIWYNSNWLPTAYFYHSIEETAAVAKLEEQRKQGEIENQRLEKEKKERIANNYKP